MPDGTPYQLDDPDMGPAQLSHLTPATIPSGTMTPRTQGHPQHAQRRRHRVPPPPRRTPTRERLITRRHRPRRPEVHHSTRLRKSLP